MLMNDKILFDCSYCVNSAKKKEIMMRLILKPRHVFIRVKRHKQAKTRKRRNRKKIPTPKTEVGKNQTNNQVLIP